MAYLYIAIGIVALGVLGMLFWVAGRAWLRYRGTRIVTCPETHEHVAVEADALHVASGAVRGKHEVRLRDCTRWPERQNCGQECLAELEESPEDCLLRNMLTDWYEGKSCAICKKPFGEIEWHDHRPALLDLEGKSFEWEEFPPEKIVDLLDDYQPICWDCHIAEKFRREHPDLVTDR